MYAQNNCVNSRCSHELSGMLAHQAARPFIGFVEVTKHTWLIIGTGFMLKFFPTNLIICYVNYKEIVYFALVLFKTKIRVCMNL